MRLAIAEARAQDNSYSAVANAEDIQAKLLETIKADNTNLKKDGWNKYTDALNTVADFKISYCGEDYKKACNDDAAEIIYTITLGQSAIEITDEVNATLKDQNGNNVYIDIGGDTGSGSGSDSGSGSGNNTGVYDEEIGIYFNAPYKSTSKVDIYESGVDTYVVFQQNGSAEIYISGMMNGIYLNGFPFEFLPENSVVYGDHTVTMGTDSMTISADNKFVVPAGVFTESAVEFAYSPETEYHDIYFETTYYGTFDDMPDIKLFADGSAVSSDGNWDCAAGGLNYSSHVIAMEDDTYLYVSMNGKDIIAANAPVFTAMISTPSASGIHFGEKYSATVDGAKQSIIFYEDGSVETYVNDELQTDDMPNFIYSQYQFGIGSSYIFGTVSSDGTQVFFGGDITFTLETSSPEETIEAGLYESGSNYAAEKQTKTWDELISEGTIVFNNGVVYVANQSALVGDLMLPNDGSVTALGDFDTNTGTGNPAFAMCTGLTGIMIPDSVTSITAMAFLGCSNLASVNLPDGITSIGTYVFGSCTSIESIAIPNSVSSFGQGSFANCASLATVTFSEGSQLTTIDDDAFYECGNLESIMIPASVTSIADGSFESCVNLSNVRFAENSQLTDITGFRNCTSITSVGPVGSGASIEIPNSITSIGYCAFSECSNLSSVTIPGSVTKLDENAFHACTSLNDITISKNMTTLGRSVFYDCTGLTTIKFEGTCGQWLNMTKDENWNYNVPATTVTCSDGTLSL